jgi:hypothetical protein
MTAIMKQTDALVLEHVHKTRDGYIAVPPQSRCLSTTVKLANQATLQHATVDTQDRGQQATVLCSAVMQTDTGV